MKPRIHADELAASGGPQVAARVGARSADHLVQVDAEGIAHLARAGTVATLLPTAAFFLKLGRFAPARDLIAAAKRMQRRRCHAIRWTPQVRDPEREKANLEAFVAASSCQ